MLDWEEPEELEEQAVQVEFPEWAVWVACRELEDKVAVQDQAQFK